jgi:hypothetical protein
MSVWLITVTEKTQIEFEENIINSNLEYKKEDDIRIKVKVISMLKITRK